MTASFALALALLASSSMGSAAPAGIPALSAGGLGRRNQHNDLILLQFKEQGVVPLPDAKTPDV
jgi:hypothetical protein